jgi:hypothetical protein
MFTICVQGEISAQISLATAMFVVIADLKYLVFFGTSVRVREQFISQRKSLECSSVLGRNDSLTLK